MTASRLRGVIAAIATPVDEAGEPDLARAVALAKDLLANGCDGLNVLGTTGEATSFSLDQRKRVMSAYRDAGIPTIHYIGPQIWAWRGGRIKKIIKSVSHMLVIFPFEEEIYKKAGVPVTPASFAAS